MEKTTVIANIRAEISVTDALQSLLAKFQDQQGAWFASDNGDTLLSEFGAEWNSMFVEVARSVVREQFSLAGLSEERLPNVELTDSRRGSWIMEAAVQN